MHFVISTTLKQIIYSKSSLFCEKHKVVDEFVDFCEIVFIQYLGLHLAFSLNADSSHHR